MTNLKRLGTKGSRSRKNAPDISQDKWDSIFKKKEQIDPPAKPAAVFLYDFTGIMAEPWRKAGYDCYIVDRQHKEGIYEDPQRPGLFKVGAELRTGWNLEPGIAERVCFLGSFPECTNVAVSGAAHFKKKGPRALALSLDLFATCRELAEKLGCPYFIENPVSTFSTYCGKPNYTFDPFEYGGYIDEAEAVHPTYPENIEDRDGYTKKTCLWTGGGFVMPPKRPVPHQKGDSLQHSKLGGKSLKTKNIRSATPRGFAEAVFQANGKKQ